MYIAKQRFYEKFYAKEYNKMYGTISTILVPQTVNFYYFY